MEIEEIKIETLPVSNFGPGLELLMNDKLKDKSEIKVDDVDKLERELNELTASPTAPATSWPPVTQWSPPTPTEDRKIKFEEVNKSWDGFKSVNAVDPDKEQVKTTELSKEEMLRNKFKYLRRLEDLERKGVSLTKKYSMESNLAEMQGEYENIIAEKEKANNVKFQGKMLMAIVTGLEFLNSKFDPFDVKLDGWAEQINENVEDYDEIFAELHEKYRSKAKLAPELKLLFQLGGSAIMLHMTNTMFKSAIPGMDDIMKQNPELMQKFTQAAVNSMSATKPGFAGFMNSVIKPEAPASYNDRRDDRRPDMKGPSDISDILGGLKSKTIVLEDDAGSAVSISELSDMKGDLKRSKKRTKSDKNTITLNI